ncbi:uncharacterized protein [Venturia canescens]|uniref:uncharacterized protein isoform X2 n=1 Tax=Venturia canescens TaxID=32260 RepID=UPI001C9CF296|nr:uncharacterized protein LOC122405755 isoform X2 [Venturia canescens]
MHTTFANKSCKSTVMKIVMKQCSHATLRSRRNLWDSSTIPPIEKKMTTSNYKSLPKTDIFPVAQGHSLGFDLTETELEELLHEINERLGRNPVPDNEDAANKTKQLFLEIAARCCQNEDECLREKIIECP